jgi:hypothetical protein
MVATCSVEPARFTPLGDEDCAALGDEDGNGSADCADPACAASCATCTDGARNADEVDVDCGGRCGPCSDGRRCGADADCDSGLCGAGACVRAASCAAIQAAGLGRGDGLYSIDVDGPPGPSGAGSARPLVAKCDMTIDGGGWTRFHWVTAAIPAAADPLGQALAECAPSDANCLGRIPGAAAPQSLMVKDLGDGDHALWRFDGTVISNAVLSALRDKTASCFVAQVPWQPYAYSGTEAFCGTGGEGGCRAFVYTSGPGCANQYQGWYLQLEGDSGCYNAAFKLGMTHAGYESIGCELPDQNYLDDGATTTDDRTGELYYR